MVRAFGVCKQINKPLSSTILGGLNGAIMGNKRFPGIYGVILSKWSWVPGCQIPSYLYWLFWPRPNDSSPLCKTGQEHWVVLSSCIRRVYQTIVGSSWSIRAGGIMVSCHHPMCRRSGERPGSDGRIPAEIRQKPLDNTLTTDNNHWIIP